MKIHESFMIKSAKTITAQLEASKYFHMLISLKQSPRLHILSISERIIEVCFCSALLMVQPVTSPFLGIPPSHSTSTQFSLLDISSHSFQGATYRLVFHHLGRLVFYRNHFSNLVSCKKRK